MITEVGAPVEMGSHISFNFRELKEVAMLSGCVGDGLFEQRPQGPAEPVVRGDVKADFASIKDGGSQFAAHQFPQNYLLPRALDLHARGKRVCEFHNPMIQEWRPHFHRMGHTSVVHLGQNIIRKKVFLVK